MAESKGSMLAKSVQKHAGRAKEKILQNLGKVDRTADEIFDDHLNNFNRQQQNANRLQKEFNNYIRCIRAAQIASKSLMDAIFEIYEPQWSGYDALSAQVQSAESLWQDFAHKLADQVLIPLNTYTGQFPEMKKKVEKRNRKLIDYDSQRHSFQSLQANANKRKDDVKLTKGREQLEEARRTYELLNTELHDELPALYESRILFLVTNLQTLFATEQVFHNETAKIYSELEAIVDKLATESQRGSNTLRKITSNAIKASSPVQSPVKQMNDANLSNSIQYQNTNGSTNQTSAAAAAAASMTPSSPSGPAAERTSIGNLVSDATAVDSNTNTPQHAMNVNPNGNAMPELVARRSTSTTEEKTVTTSANNMESITKDLDKDMNNETSTTITKTITTEEKIIKTTEGQQLNGNDNGNNNDEEAAAGTTTSTITTNTTTTNASAPTTTASNNQDDENAKTQSGDATTTDLPPGVLYRVKATYGYVKEDVDELSFEVGDIIRVIEYDDPEDQEEGWLMGEKEGTTEKGLFPANFTRPI
ncbi:amphiphysin isoform X8 [Musca autumnalis]|uniref:amphiphysin isoform X8 n=1 Tax=Musca autumnalis TaxID=221902 RepID=UPI003CEE2E58